MKTFNNKLTKLLLVFLLTLGANFAIANSVDKDQLSIPIGLFNSPDKKVESDRVTWFEPTIQTIETIESYNLMLFDAIREGFLTQALTAIEMGANVNAKNYDGRTPLIIAVWQGDIDMVQLLIDQEANVNLKDNDSKSPLQVAQKTDNWEIAQLLIQAGAEITLDYVMKSLEKAKLLILERTPEE